MMLNKIGLRLSHFLRPVAIGILLFNIFSALTYVQLLVLRFPFTFIMLRILFLFFSQVVTSGFPVKCLSEIN